MSYFGKLFSETVWKRVPPSSAFRYIPRVLSFFSSQSAVNELNKRFPERKHVHVRMWDAREQELGTAERVTQKWRIKPYEKTEIPLGDEPVPENYYKNLRDKDSEVSIEAKKSSFTFETLPDYSFPIPPGRMILQWLYDHGKETGPYQRRELRVYDNEPELLSETWTAPTAVLVGNVILNKFSGVYDHVVIRGDKNTVYIDDQTHILEGTTITTAPSTTGSDVGPVYIGVCTTVGANCHLHACKIGANTLIGSGTVIGYGAEVGEDCIVGAGSVVEPNQYIPSGEVWAGQPAKYIRKMGDVECYSRLVESWMLNAYKIGYANQETTEGDQWIEFDENLKTLEKQLEEYLGGDILKVMKEKNYDAEALKLPQSLVDYLLESVPYEDHPNPRPCVAELVRAKFNSPFQHNRVREADVINTGYYSKPNQSSQMY